MRDIGPAERREHDAVLQIFEDQVMAPRSPPNPDAWHEMVSLG
jgi:hypothetical protein